MSDKNKLQWLESLPGLSSLIVTEVLQMADELVFAQTGKHLDDIQKAVIQGVWQGNSYQEIAGEYNRSHSRVRDVGYRLWQILSEQLEEDVNKHNFRSTIERLYTVSPQIINVASNHNFNLCSQSIHQSKKENPLETEVNYQDLGTAPKISYFYGRTNELETLFNWTLTQNIRLAAVIGLSGIGKTTLIKRFIDLYSQSFEAIIWKSLKFPKPLISLLNDVLETFQIKNSNSNNFNQQLDKLIKFCQQKKCLIVFDDVQNLFFPGTFAGEYQNNYQDYKIFFQMITEIEHQSNLVLISQEQCQEMTSLDDELYPVQCLKLKGTDEVGMGILKANNRELTDRESWSKLINLYEVNPLYLQYMSSLIQDIFQGEVAEILNETDFYLTEDLKGILSLLFDRLADVEKKMVLELSKQDKCCSRNDLKELLSLSSSDIMSGLQSLDRRCLLTKNQGTKTLFGISKVFKEYLKITQQ